MGKKFSILLILLACGLMSEAQVDKSFDEIKKAQQKEFENFVEKTQKEFNQYSDSIDKEFSDYLRKNWEEFKVYAGAKRDTIPKPKALPKFNPAVDKLKPGAVPKEIEVVMPPPDQGMNPLPVPMTPFVVKEEPPEAPVPEPGPEVKRPPTEPIPSIKPIAEPLPSIKPAAQPLPVIQPVAMPKPITGPNYNFYGARFVFQADPDMNGSLPSEIHNTTIADFWDRLNNTAYSSLIKQLNDARTTMNLNDWGFYLLVKKTSEAINPDKNYSRLLSWFLLTKSGYRIRVAYTNNEIALMFPSSNTLYDTRFFITDNIKFYAPDFNQNVVLTYAKDFPGATRVFDMNLYSPLNIGDTYNAKQFKFKYKNKDYSFALKYNVNSIDFFKDYPLCDLKVYFDAVMTPQAKESVFDALKPAVEGISAADAVDFLLYFVQNGFAYKNDLEQYGKEKFDFPEEDFYYPFTDCDDRAVLFSYLVKELLGLKVIGVVYPGHVATAVHFTEEEAGDYILYRGDKYVIADPTYINAPFGLTMPGKNNAKAEVIDLLNGQNKGAELASVWEKVNTGGGFAGDNLQNSVLDQEGNSYITGYFKGYADLGGATLTSRDNSEDVFVAKYNTAGNLLWAIKGTDDGIGRGYNIQLGPDGNVYVGGTCENLMAFGAFNIIFPKNKSGLFLLKLNKGGEVQWLKQADFDTNGKGANVILYSKFSSGGEQLKSEIYPFDPNYEDYGIKFDGSGNVYYSASFSATLGFKVDKIALGLETGFNPILTLKDETEKQLTGNCERVISGLFGAISLIRLNDFSLSGQTIQQAFETYNPGFKKKAPRVFESLGKLSIIKNNNGIITVQTENKKAVILDKLKITDGTKLKVNILPSGDARIDILNGVKVGKAIIWFGLNYVKLFRNNGNVLFDYDSDHSQIMMNMQKDMLF
ncbi:MAG: hypothetical protein NTY96_12835 [Bacteroidetes bacterium]|nr:hypothetical protein [Bacteroidota bacterium]